MRNYFGATPKPAEEEESVEYQPTYRNGAGGSKREEASEEEAELNYG